MVTLMEIVRLAKVAGERIIGNGWEREAADKAEKELSAAIQVVGKEAAARPADVWRDEFLP